VDCDRIKWQSILIHLAIAHVVVYHNILDEFDMAWCVNMLIVTRNTLMMYLEDWAWDGHFLLTPLTSPVEGCFPSVLVLYAMLTLIGGHSQWTTPTSMGSFFNCCWPVNAQNSSHWIKQQKNTPCSGSRPLAMPLHLIYQLVGVILIQVTHTI
jgi:hypothetical protein